MTNDEYLKELMSRGDGSLQAWFDAEHVDSTRSAKRAAAVERLRDYESWADGVDNCSLLKAVIGVDSWGIKWKENRDALIDLLTDEPMDAQQDINRTCPNDDETVFNGGDSREKLEADARDLQSRIWDAGSRHDGISMSHIIELLDRQAEITAEESAEAWEDYSDSVQREIAELQDELTKRDKGIARLKRQRDEARDAVEYWRGQVQLCLDSAYPKSHAPERGYDPNVMGYPDRNGCTMPSTLVSDVIDGLRDAAQDGFFKARLGDMVKLEAERDEWKAKYLGAMNDVEDYKTLWHSSSDERDEWIVRAKAEKANSDGHWRNANRIAKERDALARDLAECEREREEWRAKVGAMLDAADAIRSLA